MKNVSMYTLSTCPWCRKAKKYFTDHNIPFKYVAFVPLGAHRRRCQRAQHQDLPRDY
jgi:glutaredoxin